MPPRRPLLVLLLVLLALAGCGGDESGPASPADLVPHDAALYVVADIRPEGDQAAAVDAILGRFPGLEDHDRQIARKLDEALAEEDTGITYSGDIEPWLGRQAAFFLSSYDTRADTGTLALLLETIDPDKAAATIEKARKAGKDPLEQREHKGVEYLFDRDDEVAIGLVEDHVVIASEQGFKAVVDTAEGGQQLADAERFEKATDPAPDERLGLLYVDMREIGALVRANLPPEQEKFLGPLLGAYGNEPIVLTLSAEKDAVAIDSFADKGATLAKFAGTRQVDLLENLPAESWLALGIPHLGESVKGLFDVVAGGFVPVFGAAGARQEFTKQTGLDLDRDVLDWMGDAALFVRGTSAATLDGALVIKTSDEGRSRRALGVLRQFIAREAAGEGLALEDSAIGDGFAVTGDEVGRGIQAFVQNGKVVFAYGEQAAREALEPRTRLADAAAFDRAKDRLGDDFALGGFVNVPPILQLAESFGAGDDSGYRSAKPYLEQFENLVFGGREDDDRSHSRLVVGLR